MRTVRPAPDPGALTTSSLPRNEVARSFRWRSPMPGTSAAGSNPWPSSATRSTTSSPWRPSQSWTCRARAWRATLASISCPIRNRVSCAPGGMRSSGRGSPISSVTSAPVR